MSKKIKKTKKPKFKKASFFLASEVRNYVHTKFDLDNDEFWNWFFIECPFGELSLLCFNEAYYNTISPKFKEYYNILKNDFIPDVNIECCIEIKNDL